MVCQLTDLAGLLDVLSEPSVDGRSNSLAIFISPLRNFVIPLCLFVKPSSASPDAHTYYPENSASPRPLRFNPLLPKYNPNCNTHPVHSYFLVNLMCFPFYTIPKTFVISGRHIVVLISG